MGSIFLHFWNMNKELNGEMNTRFFSPLGPCLIGHWGSAGLSALRPHVCGPVRRRERPTWLHTATALRRNLSRHQCVQADCSPPHACEQCSGLRGSALQLMGEPRREYWGDRCNHWLTQYKLWEHNRQENCPWWTFRKIHKCLPHPSWLRLSVSLICFELVSWDWGSHDSAYCFLKYSWLFLIQACPNKVKFYRSPSIMQIQLFSHSEKNSVSLSLFWCWYSCLCGFCFSIRKTRDSRLKNL